MISRSKFFLTLVVGLFVSVAAVLAYNDVPSEISPADEATAAAIMPSSTDANGFLKPSNFEEEITLIQAAQDSVLDAAPVDEGLPMGQSRELSHLVSAGQGLCYDRSRAIETILKLHGMTTRHVAVYSTADTGSALRSLLTPGVPSHAVTEVLTEKGWLVVDSNSRWIGLASDGDVFDMNEVRSNPADRWGERVSDPINSIFTKPFTWVYGLHSRHGRFYPPYTPVPDIEWSEVIYNALPDGWLK